MQFFDASRYASPLRKALDKKENAPRNLRFETLETRALLSVTPLDNLEAATASAEIAPAQTVETPVVDLSALVVSNATLESNADDQYEGETGNDVQENATQLGTLTETTTLEAFAGAGREQDWYRVTFSQNGTADHYLRLETPEGGVHVNNLFFALKSKTGGNVQHTVDVVDGAKVISLAGIPAGEYTVQVYYNTSGTASTPYALTIEPPKPETDDRFDQDDQNNDLLTTATDLGMVGSLTLADLKAGPSHNDDYYKFTTVGVGGEDDFVQVAYQYGNDAQLAFTLYDANGAELSTSKYTPDGVEKIALSGLAAGDYYLRVYNNMSVNTFARYTLTFDAPQTAPAAPTNFKTNGDEATFNKTTLSWNDVAFETGYEIRYTTDVDATDDAATWTSAGTVGADVTEFTAENLAYGTAYKFQIRALRVADGSDGLSVWDVASDWVSFDFTTVEAPKAPEELAAAPLAPETLTSALTWKDLDVELGYVVDLLDADGVSLLESPVELDADTTSWTTPALALGTTYQFKVTAINNAGDATAELTFTTENVPNAPTGLKATVADAAETSATLTWNAATETGAEAVVAYVVTYTDGQTVLTQTVDVATAENPTTCQLLNLIKGATYDVTVVAVNAYGDSAAATVKFSTLETPSTVVTTLSDVVDKYDGEISLREAIQYAEADATLGTTITFDAEAYADELDADGKATIVLGGSQLVVSQALTIDGGENGVTIDANQKSRVLQVNSKSASAFKNLTFTGGKTTGGAAGAVYLFFAKATFENVAITQNSANGRGGGIALSSSDATFKNVAITQNSSTSDGGGIYLDSSDATFENVTISQNSADGNGGGIYLAYDLDATFENVTISQNSADGNGGGIYLDRYATATFTDVEISGNTGNQSGGVYVYYNAKATFKNATITVNVGAYAFQNYGTTTIYNSLLVGHNATIASGGDFFDLGTSNAYNTLSGFTAWDNASTDAATQYVYDETQPLFTDAENGDYTLAAGSQAINKGADSYVADSITTDLAGNPRFNGTVDLGAYENQLPFAPTDLAATVLNPETLTVDLTWNDVAGNETGYVVETLVDGAWVAATEETLAADAQTWTTGKLELGTTYAYRVAAVNDYGQSDWATLEFTTENVPAQPTGLTATINPSLAPTATLTWDADENATAYEVTLYQIVVDADGETTVVAFEPQTVADATYTTGTLDLGGTYYFEVVAVNAYGESEVATYKTFTVGGVPAQPTDLEYEFNHYAKNVILTWTAVEGADAYVVEQLGADGEWTPVAPPVGNPETTETTWESGVFDFGTSHAFRVVAKNAYGSSVASDAVSFTIQDEPTVVTSLEDGDLNLLDDVTTLREALRFAQDGDEIVFAEDLRGGTITLTGGPLIIMEKEISVRGFVDETGAPELTIDGDHKDMIFVVSNTLASFFGLSVVNGYASYAKYGGGALGGGFSVDNANATFTNVDVIGCHADVYGGGIYIGSNVEAPGLGKSTLTNVRILDNVSDNGESSGQGGGLYATGGFMGGEIEMMNVEISGNQARGDGGGVFLNDITSTLTDVKITDNIAQGNGGAFYANAPDHTFISNLTGYPLLLISTKLTNVEITGNQAYKGFGFYAEEFDVEELSLRNVTLADNVGTQEGASGDVYLANGVATFYNSIVDGDLQGEEYAANAYNTLSSYADWANATDEGVVNYVLNEGDSVFAEGSYALAADSVARDKGDDAYVPETLTTDLAGNARISGLAVDLGAYEIDKEAPSTVVTTSEDVVDARDGKISLREAIQYAEAGAAITFADDVATVTLAQGELTINKAITIDGAGDVTVDANAQSRVFNVLAAGTTDAPVAFVGLTITGGNATDGAGAKVFNGAATFTNVKITGNSAQAGGAVALVRGSATFTNVEITKNTALHNGGGVFVFDGQATFANVTIADNDANNGDGVYLQATSLAASATFYNAIVADGIGLLDANPSDALVPTTNAYNTLSSYTAWTNANVEGVVNYVLNEGDSVFAEGSYALAADSVARDKGDAAYVAETNTTDLAGNARVVGTVDLGAYEIATEAPSTVVTTSEDVVDARDGKISLREAIQYAEAGATITFASDVATITLGGTELTVDKNITIDGGETGVTVDANEQSRVFSVANNTSVEFVGLTITGGYTVFEGGGVFVGGYASATFTNVEITGNEANQGGGVFLLNGASATFTNVEIAENVADFNGGGVSVTGVGVSATFTNVKITGNAANQGGGVFVVNGASATFANVEITGNTANQGGAFAVVGGASATFANATIVEADVQTAGSTAIQLLGSTATFYNSIVDAKISSLSATANAYNTLSAFTEWTNANEEGVVNYVLNEGDSLFADAANGDYALAAGSVAINKGDAAYVAETNTTDLAGNPRVVGTVDLGAYESLGVAPNAPTDLTAIVNASGRPTATLTWVGDGESATAYVVTIYDANGDVVETSAELKALEWTTTSGKLDLGETYVAAVVAKNLYGVSAATATVNFTVGNVPAAPSDLTVDFNGSIATLTWVDNADNETSYVVEKLVGENLTIIAELNADATSWATGTLEPGTYAYAIGAQNDYGVAFTKVIRFTIEAASTVVTTTNDVVDATDGEISLREALQYAEAGATITFAENLKGQTITLAGAELVVDKALTIQGFVDETGAPQITIDADGKSRVFSVNAGTADAPIKFSGLTITGGAAKHGAGISVDAKAVAEFADIAVVANEAQGVGVVRVDGVASFTRSVIAQNVAYSAAGLYVGTNGTATLTDVAIVDNAAQDSTGGGLRVDGVATFLGGEISRNSAYSGGGIYVGADGQATIANVKIADNAAQAAGGGVRVNGTATFANVEISGNQALTGGGVRVVAGGSATFVNATIVDNEAQKAGDGIQSNDGSTTFYNSIIVDEISLANTTANAYNTLSAFTEWTNATEEGVVNYVLNEGDSLFADAANGDYALVVGSVAVDKGDAAYLDEALTTDLAGNKRVLGTAVDLGAYELKTDETVDQTVVTTTDDVVNPFDCEISLREALQYAEAGATITFAENLKGQTITLAGAELIVDKALTIQGFVDETGAPQITIDADGKSRVFNVKGGIADAPVKFSGLTITGGAAKHGAGIFVDAKAVAEFADIAIVDNEAQGVGVVRVDGVASFTQSVIAQNVANSAAGLYVGTNGTATLTDVAIVDNAAQDSIGGGLRVDGVATFLGGEISRNSAYSGGGIYVGADGQATIANVKIADNAAQAAGGGVRVNGTATFANVEISGNQALTGGGVRVVAGGSATFVNATIVDNEAQGAGDGIRANDGSTTFYNSIIVDEISFANTTANAYNTLANFDAWTNADAENVVNYVLNEGDSLFADAANGDYALVAGSVAVDKGDAAYLDEALTTDLAGNERVVGTAVDLGAYELQNDATSAAFAEAFDEFDFFVDEDDLDALAKRFI